MNRHRFQIGTFVEDERGVGVVAERLRLPVRGGRTGALVVQTPAYVVRDLDGNDRRVPEDRLERAS